MASPSFKDPIEWACSVSLDIKQAMIGHDGGGGGFSLVCGVRGDVSSITGDVKWKLGCKSRHAFKCPAAITIVLRKATRTIHIEVAEGWKHVHSGAVQTQKGLPPSIKVIVDSIIASNPGIKAKALKNQLFESHSISKDEFETRIRSYYYKGCQERRKSMDISTGISSYGTVHSFVEGNLLRDLIGKHTPGINTGYLDVPGVIGFHTDVSANECYVLFSTLRLLLDGWLQSSFGYSKGQLHVDYTFKLLQEQIPFFVSSVPDIAQHVHPVSMGPCTHQTGQMVARMLKDQKDITEDLVRMIATDEGWPANWCFAARDAVRQAYAPFVVTGLVERGVLSTTTSTLDDDAHLYELDHVMADAADPLGNAAQQVFGQSVTVLMCWVHVWRAVKNKHHLLNLNTAERQSELYSDMCFVHNITEPKLVPISLQRLYEKWVAYGEKPMVEYIKKEWGPRKWMRAFTDPGEPGDNNTLESLNRVLKTDSAFGKTTSLGLCLTSCLTTIYRLSRDVRPLASMDGPVVKKEQWVLAQKLLEKSHFKLAYKMGNKIIVPSESLIPKLPGKTIAERRQNMHVWVKEFVSMMKNPEAYYKVHGANAWDFDTLMDYMYSFYVLEPIPLTHRHMSTLAKSGIIFKCNCPQYMHYHVCKHAIGYALEIDSVTVPGVFTTATVGKRSAPSGAKLSKRAKCLEVTG